MNRHDKALLDKQLWGVNPHPPGNLIGLAFIAVFFGGIITGSVLFAREHKQAHATAAKTTGTTTVQLSP